MTTTTENEILVDAEARRREKAARFKPQTETHAGETLEAAMERLANIKTQPAPESQPKQRDSKCHRMPLTPKLQWTEIQDEQHGPVSFDCQPWAPPRRYKLQQWFEDQTGGEWRDVPIGKSNQKD